MKFAVLVITTVALLTLPTLAEAKGSHYLSCPHSYFSHSRHCSLLDRFHHRKTFMDRFHHRKTFMDRFHKRPTLKTRMKKMLKVDLHV